MARTHRNPDDALNRLTGSASHPPEDAEPPPTAGSADPGEIGEAVAEAAAEVAEEEAVQRREAGEALEADAAMEEADAALREADAAMRDSDPVLEADPSLRDRDAWRADPDGADPDGSGPDGSGPDGRGGDPDAVVNDADAALAEADAALREADATLAAEAQTSILAAADPVKDPPAQPPPAIGRAAVPPPSMAAPPRTEPPPDAAPPDSVSPEFRRPDQQPPEMHPPDLGPPDMHPPEPPPIDEFSFEALYFGPRDAREPAVESYDAVLGGMGERPFDRPRSVASEVGWGATLRGFARGAVWTLPVAAVCLALSGMWGWPTRASEPAGESPGTWLVVTVFGLILGLAGVLAMTALLVATPGRNWAVGALVLVLTGTVLLAPVLGVLALARPAVTRATGQLSPETATSLDNHFLDNAVSRWLSVGGLALLATGWLAFGCAVLASGVLSRVDGYLVLCAVVIAVLAAYVSWQFLITVAAIVLLAAGLGLAWTAHRLKPDGQLAA